MKNLRNIWLVFFFIGAALIGIDAISDTLFRINGFPALGVIGGALILLVLTSILNWIFKVAWKERNTALRPGLEDRLVE